MKLLILSQALTVQPEWSNLSHINKSPLLRLCFCIYRGLLISVKIES